jgi:hypothetical protein
MAVVTSILFYVALSMNGFACAVGNGANLSSMSNHSSKPKVTLRTTIPAPLAERFPTVPPPRRLKGGWDWDVTTGEPHVNFSIAELATGAVSVDVPSPAFFSGVVSVDHLPERTVAFCASGSDERNGIRYDGWCEHGLNIGQANDVVHGSLDSLRLAGRSVSGVRGGVPVEDEEIIGLNRCSVMPDAVLKSCHAAVADTTLYVCHPAMAGEMLRAWRVMLQTTGEDGSPTAAITTVLCHHNELPDRTKVKCHLLGPRDMIACRHGDITP